MVGRVTSEEERFDTTRSGGERLLLAADVVAGIEEDLEQRYPREGCGVLLGRLEGDRREVTGAVTAKNVWDGRADRYQVDPDFLGRLMTEEADGGPTILGFYHSHPDVDPEPSATDRELAWPWYDYVIWPVRDGVAGPPRAWRLAEDRFVEIGLEVLQQGLHSS